MIIKSNLLTILFIRAGTKYYIYITPEKTGETKNNNEKILLALSKIVNK